MNNDPTYVEYTHEFENTSDATIMHEPWIAKWNEMTAIELEAEHDSLISKLRINENDKIHIQLTEVLDLFTKYKKTHKAKE